MPVRKFRSVDEMNQRVWREPGSDELLRAIEYVWELGRRTSRRQFPPGVYKHRGIEEAQAQRERWLAEHLRGSST